MIIIPDNSQAGFYAQKVIHNSMQVMGGIGYTNVFPVERIYRDVRLASIWTGTSEVMSMITAHQLGTQLFC
jgi:butyryl-CoA dehydrogenase